MLIAVAKMVELRGSIPSRVKLMTLNWHSNFACLTLCIKQTVGKSIQRNFPTGVQQFYLVLLEDK